jgi:8-amino-7-oxononanoate synthase
VPTSSTPTHTSLDERLAAALVELRERGLGRTLRSIRGRSGVEVVTPLGPAVDFSSNDYLGLASDPRLTAAATRVAHTEGIGATAARLIAGNHPEHEALERELATFVGAERALLFSSGYAANLGTIPALVGRGDVIFSDALNHASVIDGCRLSRATVCVYPHGDAAALASLLDRERRAHGHALIVTEGVFSMDGDRAPLGAIVELAQRYDAWTYVDDAHAVGVLGPSGRGTAESLAIEGVDVTMGALGKAFGTAGAFVHGSATLCEYLLNRARTFIFSTAMLPAQAGAARVALAIASDEPSRRQRVRENARMLRGGLARHRVAVAGDDDSHIVPIIIGGAAATVAVGEALALRGLLAGAVRPPTVADGGSRLRVTVSAAHTAEQIQMLVDAIVALIGRR